MKLTLTTILILTSFLSFSQNDKDVKKFSKKFTKYLNSSKKEHLKAFSFTKIVADSISAKFKADGSDIPGNDLYNNYYKMFNESLDSVSIIKGADKVKLLRVFDVEKIELGSVKSFDFKMDVKVGKTYQTILFEGCLWVNDKIIMPPLFSFIKK